MVKLTRFDPVEMIDDAEAVAAFLADAASRILCRDGLYHALAEAILDRAAPSVRT